MGARGRKSASDLSVIGPAGVVTVRRPQAPEQLTDEQAEEWRAIVNRLPADWFPRETHGVLVQLCRHIIRAQRISQLLDAMESSDQLDMKEYRDLLASEAQQSNIIAALSTKLRITQQATVDKRKSKGAIRPRPWDIQSRADHSVDSEPGRRSASA